MNNDPTATLTEGIKILEPLMNSHGFALMPLNSGVGSGMTFASSGFQRDDRLLELHFRYSLGLVTYHVGPVTLSHEDYMWSVLGRQWASSYPGFSVAPLDAFRDLLRDLEQHGSDFLSGSEASFINHAAHVAQLRELTPRLR